jgi:hypothetical protein
MQPGFEPHSAGTSRILSAPATLVESDVAMWLLTRGAFYDHRLGPLQFENRNDAGRVRLVSTKNGRHRDYLVE